MPRRFSYAVERTGHADVESAFSLLSDATQWSRWAGRMIPRSGWADGGQGPAYVGRVRVAGQPPVLMREEVTVDEPPHRHGYVIRSGWPVRDYSSLVELQPGDQGLLTVRWTGEFSERIPLTGAPYRRFLIRLMGGLIDGLLAAADAER
ncbi:SRPBCC family protein [Nocardioides acrostichi]|uniref:SRPBCC family protein n=1 Tax=Nocardioides acrostichi TaxID=2784339 RepID=A0A930V3X5_9ACTN|nr:SRPBCC family protein [Nocardioides acrostichi]MBF4163260.1 SRPBCC family protein [Nocardioides acrostichi]